MDIGNSLPVPLTSGANTIPGEGHSLPTHDMLTDIIRRSTGNQSAEAPRGLDLKRLVERAMEIDNEHSVSPLTEGQWDYGLDMLARAEAPGETGLALRQERIIVALSKALAEFKDETSRMSS